MPFEQRGRKCDVPKVTLPVKLIDSSAEPAIMESQQLTPVPGRKAATAPKGNSIVSAI